MVAEGKADAYPNMLPIWNGMGQDMPSLAAGFNVTKYNTTEPLAYNKGFTESLVFGELVKTWIKNKIRKFSSDKDLSELIRVVLLPLLLKFRNILGFALYY